MSFRVLKNDPFTKTMSKGNSAIAMNSASSKGFSVWVNKDIREAESTGDWSKLIDKALKSQKSFRNSFYK
jgi:hypothetical protein